jgi:hypothetical protein
MPIANKWVFMKKYNKKGDLLKYKGRLVVKGYVQCPGHDYVKTFSPVIRLETLWGIMALAAIKDLKMQQMDVKGAYLNSRLKEKVYMHQPEGFDNGTGRICLLIKAIYGLKQSGHKWNNEFNEKLMMKDFKRLCLDPCAYVQTNGEDLEIITVWVDDLLPFASSNELIERIKLDLRSKWEITDLGEPTKIVGIEIARNAKAITISQPKYIESVLKREGLENVNPMAMPMDLNMKLMPNPDSNEGSQSNSYAQLIGKLQFLATVIHWSMSCTTQ